MSSQQNKKKTIHAHTIIIFDVTLLIQNLLGFHGWGGDGGVIHNSCFALGNKKYDIL